MKIPLKMEDKISQRVPIGLWKIGKNGVDLILYIHFLFHVGNISKTSPQRPCN